MYSDDEMLMLSGIQHYRFCPRQWALIHIDRQWDDNRLTVEGQILHKHVDDPFYRQKCGDFISLRTVCIASHELGLYGYTDVVELHPADDIHNSISHPRYPGRWMPYPIEYKHGKPKKDETDKVQLAAQAICLEEIYQIHISYGAIFYAEVKHRVEVEFTETLREVTKSCAIEMHKIFQSGVLPKAVPGLYCKKCSLYDLCMPELANRSKVSVYLKQNLYEETS
mgnify:CR=1 FL=1